MSRYSQARADDPVTDVDVVVVGARCAGASTALLLARAGHDVLMIDRSRPSADTTSTHAFVRGGVVQLARWGLLDDVLASGVPPVSTVSFHRDGRVERRRIRHRAGVGFLIAPRRGILDDLLARAAVAAGARLWTRTTVTGVLRSGDGRVTGVTVREADGTTRRVTARLVVGADGVRSRLAEAVGAEIMERHQPSGAAFYTYVDGVPWDGFEFHVAERFFAGVFPTHAGQACVWLMRPAADLASVTSAGAGRLEAWLAALEQGAPELARRIRGGRVVAPLRGSVGLPNQVRRPTGPGWALVGDAGYHRDPVTGHGMTDAFRDAELLAHAADRGLRGEEPLDEALQCYATRRDAALASTFAITRTLGAFPPTEQVLELQVRLSRELDAEAHYLASLPGVGRPYESVTDSDVA